MGRLFAKAAHGLVKFLMSFGEVGFWMQAEKSSNKVAAWNFTTC